MKIAMVIDTYNEGNGGCLATKRLVQGLRGRGHEVVIVSTTPVDDSSYVVKGHYLPGLREPLEKMQFLFGVPDKAVLRQAFADVDLVQIQFPFYLGYGAAKIAKAMNKTIVGAFHIQPQNVIAATGSDSALANKALGWFFKFFLLGRAPVIHCPSQFAADLLGRLGSTRPSRIVSNGIPDEFVPTPQERPEFFGDDMVLMSLGRHAPEKRHALLIEGVKRARNAAHVKLLLCGKGELTDGLIAQGADLPVPPLIRYVTDEEKKQYLNTADLFVHGSSVDLESLACLEAIGCGLPCLVTDSAHSAASQFALDDRFLFANDDPDSLAERIDYWYEHRDELKAARERVLKMAENYRFEHVLDKMESLYREALAGRFDTVPMPARAVTARGVAE